MDRNWYSFNSWDPFEITAGTNVRTTLQEIIKVVNIDSSRRSVISIRLFGNTHTHNARTNSLTTTCRAWSSQFFSLCRTFLSRYLFNYSLLVGQTPCSIETSFPINYQPCASSTSGEMFAVERTGFWFLVTNVLLDFFSRQKLLESRWTHRTHQEDRIPDHDLCMIHATKDKGTQNLTVNVKTRDNIQLFKHVELTCFVTILPYLVKDPQTHVADRRNVFKFGAQDFFLFYDCNV